MSLFSKKEKVTISVEGMHCAMCVKNLTRGLKEANGISDAVVSLEEKNAVVTFDPAKIDEDGIRAVVRECGYQPV